MITMTNITAMKQIEMLQEVSKCDRDRKWEILFLKWHWLTCWMQGCIKSQFTEKSSISVKQNKMKHNKKKYAYISILPLIKTAAFFFSKKDSDYPHYSNLTILWSWDSLSQSYALKEGFPGGSAVRNVPVNAGDGFSLLGS